jgi:predicted transposase/invertase (TIGR01784 family)
MLFTQHPKILKHLVAAALGISIETVNDFTVMNPEIVPDALGDKFCRLDINMRVDGKLVDLEVQVGDEGNYPERSLYYWAREYSAALPEGSDYIELPQAVVISILDFNLFDCVEYHSEFRPLEVRRGELLSDRMVLHYFEVRKLPKSVDVGSELELFLALFGTETEEELERLQALGVPIVTQAITAYRKTMASAQLRELERLRDKARVDGMYALNKAKAEGILEGEKRADEKWQRALDALRAEKEAEIAQFRAMLNIPEQ